MRRISGSFAIGPEAVAMGSRYYNQIRLGLMPEATGVYGNAHINVGF